MIKYRLRQLIIGLGLYTYLSHSLVTSVKTEEEGETKNKMVNGKEGHLQQEERGYYDN